MTEITTQPQAPEAYCQLVWDIFFAERSRGVDLTAHFPWLAARDDRLTCVVATHGGTVVGGLVMRKDPEQADIQVASVGLVCVAHSHRGHGVSRLLLDACIAEARGQGLDALRLWTGKPRVYESAGFMGHDTALYGWATRERAKATASATTPPAQRWPTSQSGDTRQRGLPPFARAASQWQSGDATLVAVEDTTGLIVAEWSGPDAAVATLMGHVLPARVRINALLSDGLPVELARHGWDCRLERSALQMVLPLSARGAASWSQTLCQPRMLDRI
jgi:GNAT superfamily N-acetyltransferase